MFTAALVTIAKPQKQSGQHIYNASTVCRVPGSTEVSDTSPNIKTLIIYLMIKKKEQKGAN